MIFKVLGVIACLFSLFFLIDVVLRFFVSGPKGSQILPLFMGGGFWALGSTLFRYRPSRNPKDQLKIEFVTVATYSVRTPADLAKVFLEQNGIESFIIDDNVVTADWFLGPALGWIKLQVAGKDAQAAVAFLESHPNLLKSSQVKKPDAIEANQCLDCGKVLDDNAKSCDACGWTFSDADAEDETQEKEKAQG